MSEKQIDLLALARKSEAVSREIRTSMLYLNVDQQGEIQTMRYCGALASLVASTLSELHAKLHPVFSKDTINGILREWGEEELLS